MGIVFRNNEDKWHLFGSLALTACLAPFIGYAVNIQTPELKESAIALTAVIWLGSAMASFTLGFFYECYQAVMAAIGLDYDARFWSAFPDWFSFAFSGDKFDKQDIKLNAMGAFILPVAYHAIKDSKR